MRIAHVISSQSVIGGAERVLLQLAQAGSERGWDQRVLHLFGEVDGLPLSDLCPRGTYLARPCSDWREVPAVRAWTARKLRDFRPDIVHVHLFHALVLVASLRRGGARLVLTHHHGSRYIEEPQPMREWVDRLCVRRYDAVVAVSEPTRRVLAERYGLPAGRLWTIPNGWSGEPRPRTAPSGHRIVCVANFRRQKGHDVLLAAFAEVLQRVPDAELLLVGDGALRAEIEQAARTFGVAGRVEFAGEVVDVWPYLAQADVFALASRYEPFGIAAIEAMAAGLPVVATGVDGLKDIVEPGVTGELVAPGDPRALAASLVALLESPGALTAMSAASRERAAGHRADRMIDQYVALYGQVLEDRPT